MKYRFIFFLLYISAISQAQEVKTQKEILLIPNTTLSDFNLKNGNRNIVPIKVSKATYTDRGFAFVKKEFSYGKDDYSLETLIFKNGLLQSKTTEFKYGSNFLKPKSFAFYYSFDSNGNLSKRTSETTNDGSNQITYYSFNKDGTIKEIRDTGVLGNGEKFDNQQVFSKKGNKLSYELNTILKTYYLKNRVIIKEESYNKKDKKGYNYTYSYNENGFLLKKEGGSYVQSFVLNDKNLIQKEVNKLHDRNFQYVYDKYGNWIVAYQLSTTEKDYSGKKTSPKLFGSSFSFLVREIKYSNGEVTGGKTPEHTNIKSSLLKVRSELYDELINGKKPYVAKNIRYFDLGLPLTDLVEDFGLKIGNGNIIPKQINKQNYDQRTKRGSTELLTTLGTKSYQTFNTKTKKVTAFNVVRNNKTTYYTYTYDSSGRLITYLNRQPTIDVKESYKYSSNGNFSKQTSYNGKVQPTKQEYKKTDYGFISSGISNQKFYLKNNLLEKTVTNYNSKEPSENYKTYNSMGKIIKSESSFYTNTYDYNSNGFLRTSKETNKNSGDYTKRSYAYKYDKYGNWVIQVSLLDMSIARGIPSFPNPTLREITYSNGEKTGTTDITKVEKDLIELRRKVKNANTNISSQVMTWKKTSKTNFRFYFSNKETAKITNRYMGNHLLVFDVDDRQLYLLENFANSPLNKLIKAKKINIDTKNGFWFKQQNGGVTVFDNNGEYLKESDIYKYAPNQIDVIFQGKGESDKVVLMNYKNAEVLKVYPRIKYNSYKGNKTITNNKSVKRTGKCLKGDCNNGYGEFKHTNGYMSEGFFRNGTPYGPMHVSKESANESSLAFLLGNYTSVRGMKYRYYGNRYTEIIDINKQIGLLNDAKERKSYQYNFKDGKAVSKTLLQEKANTGCIVGNCYNGAGVYKYNSGSFYFGYFKNGKRHGFGKLDFKDGKQYIGEFNLNTYSGMGTYIISEYNYYMGEFENNTYNGKGVMYYNKNKYDAGIWKNGKLTTKNNTRLTNNTNYNSTNTQKFSSKDISEIKKCGESANCIRNYFYKLYEQNKEKAEINKIMRGYFIDLHKMNPKLAFNIIMGIDSYILNAINVKSLPNEIQADLRKRAQVLADGYKKHIKKQGY